MSRGIASSAAIKPIARRILGGRTIAPIKGVTFADEFVASEFGANVSWLNIRAETRPDGLTINNTPDSGTTGITLQQRFQRPRSRIGSTPPFYEFEAIASFFSSNRNPYDFAHQGPASIVARLAVDDLSTGAQFALYSSTDLASNRRGIALYIDDTDGKNALCFVLKNGLASDMFTIDILNNDNDLPSLDTGYHTFGAAWDGSSARLYFDGQELASASNVGAFSALQSSQNPHWCAFGNTPTPSASPKRVRHIAIYSETLSASTMTAIHGTFINEES